MYLCVCKQYQNKLYYRATWPSVHSCGRTKRTETVTVDCGKSYDLHNIGSHTPAVSRITASKNGVKVLPHSIALYFCFLYFL